MAQHDYVIDNGSGSAVRADINSLAEAIVTLNSGTSAPSVTFPFMYWSDTTANLLKQRNAANTSWITIRNLDGTQVDNTITDAKLRQSSGLSVIGRSANSTGNVADIVGTDGQVLRVSGTALGFGTIATAGLADNAVTDGKLRDSAALSVIGRASNSSGDPADIAAANDGEVLRRSGTAIGFGTIATAGLADNAVTDGKLRQSVGLSVIGRSANSTGNVADIAAANDGEVLRRSGTAIGFGTLATAGLSDDAVTNAKLGNMAANTIKGRITSGTGDPEDLTAANVKTILALVKGDVGLGNVDDTSDATKWAATKTLTNTTIDANGTGNAISNIEVADLAAAAIVTAAETIGANNVDTAVPTAAAVKAYVDAAASSGVADGDKGDITVSASGLTWTIDASAIDSGKIAANAVTNAKLAQMAVNTIKGRITSGTGDPEDLTAANVKTILALVKGDVGLGNVDNTSDATKFDDIAGRIRGINEITGTTHTFALTDNGTFVVGNNAAAQTFTVPPNSTTAFPVGKTVINVGQYGAGRITIAAGAGVTIRSAGSRLKIAEQYGTGALVKRGTDEWWFFGNTAA